MNPVQVPLAAIHMSLAMYLATHFSATTPWFSGGQSVRSFNPFGKCTYLERKIRNKYQRNRNDYDRVLLVIFLTFEPIIGTINVFLYQLLSLSIADKDSNVLLWCGSPVWIVIAFLGDLHAPCGTLTILPSVN